MRDVRDMRDERNAAKARSIWLSSWRNKINQTNQNSFNTLLDNILLGGL